MPDVVTTVPSGAIMNWSIPALLMSLPVLWLYFVLLYGSFKVFKWLRKWKP
ncbi:hypothetical protein KAH43_06735 [Candidatus Bipolaricaulota bacterium]|nr:hypothetical protein [Candidatus Bipolaricaulota bacterium]